MDREATPIRQRQKRGSNQARRSSNTVGGDKRGSRIGTNDINDIENGTIRVLQPSRSGSMSHGHKMTTPSAILTKPTFAPTILKPDKPPSAVTSTVNIQTRQSPRPEPAFSIQARPLDNQEAAARSRNLQHQPHAKQQSQILQSRTSKYPQKSLYNSQQGTPSPTPRYKLSKSPFTSSSTNTTSSTTVFQVKLINSHYQLSSLNEISADLSSCLDLSNFTVIGVLGQEKVGKSTILSHLMEPQEITQCTHSSSVTTGIEVTILKSIGQRRRKPLILLDTQPLFSSTILRSFIPSNSSGVTSNTASSSRSETSSQQISNATFSSSLTELERCTMQLAIFLFSVCDFVGVVSENLSGDNEISNFLKDMLDCWPSTTANPAATYCNVRPRAKIIAISNQTFDGHYRFYDSISPESLLYPKEILYNRNISRSVHFLDNQNETKARETTHISPAMFCFPRKGNDEVDDLFYNDVKSRWKDFVQALPSAKAHHSGLMTLRDWLSNAFRVYEAVKKMPLRIPLH